MAELLCAIDRGFFAADGRTALHVRSIVASLTRMAELLCVRDRSWVVAADGGLVVRSQKIACGSEVCAAKSCFACVIDRGFVAADGRGLAARSMKCINEEICSLDIAIPPCSQHSKQQF